jgi:hypothetical protein
MSCRLSQVRLLKNNDFVYSKSLGSPICQDLQEAVFQCYQAHPKQTLLCTEQVKAFSQCVQQQREVGLPILIAFSLTRPIYLSFSLIQANFEYFYCRN